MKTRYFIKTFGCQMNEADSERIITALEKKKYLKTEDIRKADLVVINSCIVRQSAENRVYGLIRNLKKRKPLPKIILTGCLAGWALNDQSDKNLTSLKKKTGSQVEIIATDKLAGIETKPKRTKTDLADPAGSSFAYIPISNGCNHLCSYCIVPYARGQEIYRSTENIIIETECALKQGFKKIMLLGQNVNSWQGKGKVKTFPQLLEKTAQIPGIKEISFLSANPWDFSDQLIAVIARNKNISREIHLPLQSGSNQILKKMNRSYTAKQYLALIRKIRNQIKGAVITTDIIVGFPGETKKAFQETVNLCQKIGFKRVFVAKYSPRPGAIATKIYQDKISPQEKKRRWRVIDKLINH